MAHQANCLVPQITAKKLKPHTEPETIILPACSAVMKTIVYTEK